MVPTSGHDVDHAGGYERFLLSLYVAWRALSVVVYGTSTWETRAHFRRPRLAGAAWLLMAAEFAWSTRRLLGGGSRHRRAVTGWVDTAVSAALLVLFSNALEPDDGDPWRSWHIQHALAQARATPVLIPDRAHRIAMTSALIASHAAGSALTPGRTDWGDVARTGAAMAFFSVSSGFFADVLLGNGQRLDDAHVAAVRAAEDVARQHSRARHRRQLQTSAVTVLESVAAAEHPRDPGLRRAANLEAGRLRRVLLPNESDRPELAPVVDEAAEWGIDLEVVYGERDLTLAPAAVEAIRGEVAEAAQGSAAGTIRHVVLFVDRVADTLVVTLRGSDIHRDLRLAP
ncbi:MAG: hypothetical protein U0U69_11895 [Acidimicrobiia bacterium]